ncbi:hypothetical protein VTI74DRAFT_11076 [Chaetomium olivicolor]
MSWDKEKLADAETAFQVAENATAEFLTLARASSRPVRRFKLSRLPRSFDRSRRLRSAARQPLPGKACASARATTRLGLFSAVVANPNQLRQIQAGPRSPVLAQAVRGCSSPPSPQAAGAQSPAKSIRPAQQIHALTDRGVGNMGRVRQRNVLSDLEQTKDLKLGHEKVPLEQRR